MLNEGNQLHILYCVCEITVPEPYLITVQVPLVSVIKLRFRFRYDTKLRLRFRNTGDATGKSDHVNIGRFLHPKMHEKTYEEHV